MAWRTSCVAWLTCTNVEMVKWAGLHGRHEARPVLVRCQHSLTGRPGMGQGGGMPGGPWHDTCNRRPTIICPHISLTLNPQFLSLFLNLSPSPAAHPVRLLLLSVRPRLRLLSLLSLPPPPIRGSTPSLSPLCRCLLFVTPADCSPALLLSHRLFLRSCPPPSMPPPCVTCPPLLRCSLPLSVFASPPPQARTDATSSAMATTSRVGCRPI